MKKFFLEFKEFAMRGNVLDMAVGVILGGAFGKITTSLVNDVFMPLIGMLIGGVGTLIYQLLRYGIAMLTPLWILPYVLCGLLVGWWAKKKDFSLGSTERITLVVLGELLVTVLNTGVLYLDSKLMGYWFPGFITGALALRLVICVGKAVVFGLVLPGLMQAAGLVLHGRRKAR